MRLQEFQEEALERTPIPETSYEALSAGGHRSAWGTWFETAKPYSVMNSTYEVGSPLYILTLWGSNAQDYRNSIPLERMRAQAASSRPLIFYCNPH